MNAGAELLAALHEKNERLLHEHAEDEILELMDRAALAGYLYGAHDLSSQVIGALVVMAAKLGVGK